MVKNKDERIKVFLRLHSIYQHRIYGFIMSAIGDWNQADDIFQETMGVLWNKFDQFVFGTNFLSWALKVTHYQILSHIKKQTTQNKYFCQETIENIREIAVSSAYDSDESLKALRKCVKKLPEKSKKMLSLRYEDGASIQMIAQQIQQSVNTLYKSFQKIHYLLFQCIRKELEWD
jgi:RNA polymerase sigma-70 factor (ECF subfamily)